MKVTFNSKSPSPPPSPGIPGEGEMQREIHLPVIQPSKTSADPPQSNPAKIVEDLESLDVGELRFDRHNRLLYSTDASLYQVEPLGVVVPQTIEQIVRLVHYCAGHRIALLPRGGGTSLAGQCTNQAIVVDMSPGFRKLISVDVQTMTCDVEPGVTIDELNRQLLASNTGLFFPVDPATTAQAAIGGCIGNNAAGSRSIRYGRTSENLAGVEVILTTGQRVVFAGGAGRANPVARQLAEQVIEIVRSSADEIRLRFPKLVRRNAGYALDLVLQQIDRGFSADDLDLSGLITGSEGTLALISRATLKLQPIPKARGLAIASFATLEAAIAAVPAILATLPSAVELLDDVVLESASKNAQCRPYVELLPKLDRWIPRAALYVEYQAERSIDELDAGFDLLRKALPGIPLAIYRDQSAMLQAWTLRKNSEALLHGLSAGRKPITVVEDNAVPVENLARFVAGFKQIVGRHGTAAAYYAHASVGVLHVRPMLDLHDPNDVIAMQAIAVEVADLARECGGVMSGEHGDGRVRGPLLERFYGPVIMDAFRKIKHAFDPQNILNPGMIVDAGPIPTISQNLRVQAEHRQNKQTIVETYFDYSDQENFDGAVEMCNGAGFCRKTAGGTMCPSYRATLDERHSTRGRGNALRLAITGQAFSDAGTGPAWNDPGTIETLDLCLSCKACKTECPSNVDLSRLKAEYTAQRFATTGRIPFAVKIFGHIRRINRLASIAPGLVNWLNSLKITRALVNHLLNLAPQRSLPHFGPSLVRWFNKRMSPVAAASTVVFADCFTTYNEPHIGRAAVTLLESLGYRVVLADAGCCGRSMISTGLLPAAIRTIDDTLNHLRTFHEARAIVVLEPSCLSAIKDDWLQLKLNTPREIRERVAGQAMLVEDFVERFWHQHPNPLHPASFDKKVVLHGHCHQKALWGDQTSAAALKRMVGERLTVLPSGCCGMAGAFGFTANHYDVSMRIGELSVFPPVRSAAADAEIVAPGTSCRHQILDGTGRRALHPVELLAMLMTDPRTAETNGAHSQ